MSQQPLTGKTLRNHYKIGKLLGSGAFGYTYLAFDLDLPGQPPCVVKHLNPKDRSPYVLETAKRLFEKEAQILYRLGNEHEQIPKLFAHFEENGEFYLVQEFVDGDNLEQEINQASPKRAEVALKLLKDILEVLAFVHQQNVIHRDIKPQNLMRRKDGKIVLIDFGAVKELSALTSDPQGQSALTVAIGTRGYMPNEQVNGKPELSSDIYAVGVMALQALSGLFPQQLSRDKNGELSCALLPNGLDIDYSFAEILNKMVRRDYTERYQNATDALKALQEYIDISQASTVAFRPSDQTSSRIPHQEPFQNYLSGNETSLFQRIFQFFRQLFSETSETDAGDSQHVNVFEQPEGQVSLKSAFYVERQPMETDCYEAILQPGALIRVKAPRQMGKTSLLTRILRHGEQHNYRTAYINFQLADVDFFTNLDKFLRWFCGSVTQELNLKDKLSEYWQGFLGNKDNCTNYFQRYLLSEISNPVIIGLDEVDRLFQYPQVSSEFFALLRAWHETSKNKEIWKKFRLVIVHSQEVYIPLNINQSPFNVGLPIALPEFSSPQVEYLVQQHGLKWTADEIQQFMVMLGGHPYLVRKGLYEIARGGTSLSQLLRIAPTEQGFYRDHLRRHLSTLQEDSQLANAMKEVAKATYPVLVDSALGFKLSSMGLVKFQENNIIPSCELYRRYFRERLS